MNIPEHIKQQAVEAVSSTKIAAQMRAQKGNGIDVSHDSMFTQAEKEPVNPISEHVKRQADEAVSSTKFATLMRAQKGNGIDVSHDSLFTQAEKETVSPIPEHAKRAALDAVSHAENIRLASHAGEVVTPITPMRGWQRAAEQVVRLHRSKHGFGFIHRTITNDGFGRD